MIEKETNRFMENDDESSMEEDAVKDDGDIGWSHETSTEIMPIVTCKEVLEALEKVKIF